MVVTGGALTVPTITVITRKAYGLGAQAMACGGFRAPLAVIGWPTAELGGMGLEGAVKLGQRKELEADSADSPWPPGRSTSTSSNSKNIM